MKQSLVVQEVIEQKILLIRGQKVMLSIDLAALYEVEHRTVMQAVRRNREWFPDDFIFQLTKEEFGILKSRFVTSSWAGSENFPMLSLISLYWHIGKYIRLKIQSDGWGKSTVQSLSSFIHRQGRNPVGY
jgi:hypothetical protein